MSDAQAKDGIGTILVVDTRLTVLRRTGELLRRAGHDVIEATSFDDAKRLLTERRPSLLLSSLRLGAFNGLHLVHRARLGQPKLSAIIVSADSDAALQSEAERVGASLVVEPVPTTTLLSLIERTLEAVGQIAPGAAICNRRHCDRRRLLIAGFAPERRRCERRAVIVASI
jgi:DNA-binding NtrC family response regulator